MITSFNALLPIIQPNLFVNQLLPKDLSKNVKVTIIALVSLGALAVIYFMYRAYRSHCNAIADAKKVKVLKEVQHPLTPVIGKVLKHSPSVSPQGLSGIQNDEELAKKLQEIENSQKLTITDDEKLAKLLHAEEESKLIKQGLEISDLEFAKELQKEEEGLEKKQKEELQKKKNLEELQKKEIELEKQKQENLDLAMIDKLLTEDESQLAKNPGSNKSQKPAKAPPPQDEPPIKSIEPVKLEPLPTAKSVETVKVDPLEEIPKEIPIVQLAPSLNLQPLDALPQSLQSLNLSQQSLMITKGLDLLFFKFLQSQLAQAGQSQGAAKPLPQELIKEESPDNAKKEQVPNLQQELLPQPLPVVEPVQPNPIEQPLPINDGTIDQNLGQEPDQLAKAEVIGEHPAEELPLQQLPDKPIQPDHIEQAPLQKKEEK